jgi:hypothetical protein
VADVLHRYHDVVRDRGAGRMPSRYTGCESFLFPGQRFFLAGFPACLFRQVYNRESSTEGFHLVEATQDSKRLGSGVWQDGLARTDFRCACNLNLPEATTISVEAIVWSVQVNLNHLIERFLHIPVTENEQKIVSRSPDSAPLTAGRNPPAHSPN